MPEVTSHASLIGIVEQALHIRGIESSMRFCHEIRSDVGKIEMDSVSLRCFINPVKVAGAARIIGTPEAVLLALTETWRAQRLHWPWDGRRASFAQLSSTQRKQRSS
jgi:hypothetical protein